MSFYFWNRCPDKKGITVRLFLEWVSGNHRIMQNDNEKRINHIGSTAVVGLISKPIIDILLEI